MILSIFSEPNLILPFLLVVLAIALIFAEVFIPSFGILGTLAILSLLGAIILAFRVGPWQGTVFIALAIAGSAGTIVLAYRLLPYTPIGKKLFMAGEETKEEKERVNVDRDLDGLLGKEGVTMSTLRPAGFAEVEGDRVDVVTGGEMIESGVRVKIIQIDGNRAVVTRVKEATES